MSKKSDAKTTNKVATKKAAGEIGVKLSDVKLLAPISNPNKVVAIANIDTRKLTRLLREKGAQAGCLMTGEALNEDAAIQQARAFPGLAGMDLAKVVTTAKPYPWSEGEWSLGNGFTPQTAPLFHVVAYDFGVKHNILRILNDKGCHLTVVPAQTSAAEVLAMNPDGVFLSNGPGDPQACDYAIRATQEFLEHGIPTFGICLGFQILALACGGVTKKMKFGHHGANHPVVETEGKKRVFITSQNHGFTVDESSLPDCLMVTHRSLFDNTLQGIRHKEKPALGFQGHPEASPGPHDIEIIFNEFINLMK